MSLFVKETHKTKTDGEEFEKHLEQSLEKNRLFLTTILSLFYFIKEFSLDIVELEPYKFKSKIDVLSNDFIYQEDTKTIEKSFDKHKGVILSFIEREKDYLNERDSELRKIIVLLSNGLREIGGDNETFNTTVHEKSMRIEEIIRLDDIKEVRRELKQELHHLKQATQNKRTNDVKHLAELSSTVDRLQSDLQQVKTQDQTDNLTGVFNRDAFNQYLSTLVGRNTATSAPFSLLMLDIDNLTQRNDIHGRNVGDRILMALAQQCSALIRKDDFIARFDGDVFALILPGASLRHAQKKGRAICKSIAGTKYVIDHDRPMERLAFTVSIGISSIHKGDTVETVSERANNALLLAKQQGKNRIISEKSVT
jgi:diguanylate cyclase (GGDEF)-like protein